MNLIRNGGFETGDVRFWDLVAGVSFEADNSEQKYGTYSGNLAMTGATGGVITTRDYIAVNPYEVIDFSAQILTNGSDDLYVYIKEYTEDLSFIGHRQLHHLVLPAAWTNLKSQFRLGAEVNYIQLSVHVVLGATPSNMYFDSVILNKVESVGIPARSVELCNLTNLTASGDTTSDLKDLYGFREYYAEIDVTSMTGTTPTCDVTICEWDIFGNERVIGTFTQFNGVTDQRIGIGAPITGDMYVKYVMGGTVTDCDFKVGVIGVR